MSTDPKPTQSGTPRSWLGRVWSLLLRTGVLFPAWLALTEADPSALGVGLIASVTIAAFTLRWLQPGRGWRPQYLPALLLYLMVESVRSGFDVSLRAIGLRPLADPGMVRVPLESGDTLRVLLAYAVTSLPGTVATEVTADCITVHALDRKADVQGVVLGLERRLRRVFSGPITRSPDV